MRCEARRRRGLVEGWWKLALKGAVSVGKGCEKGGPKGTSSGCSPNRRPPRVWICCPPDYKIEMRSQSRNHRNSTPAGRTLFGPFLAAKHSRVASCLPACLPACLGCGAETNTSRSPTPCMHPSPHLFSTGLRLLAAAPTYALQDPNELAIQSIPPYTFRAGTVSFMQNSHCESMHDEPSGSAAQMHVAQLGPCLGSREAELQCRARAIYLALLHRHHLAPR
ncbi:hypothetical protein L1887_58029 [Cichorium endivia]|nr:hypothetical protein L1887_58029 [Cichorium endivia]